MSNQLIILDVGHGTSAIVSDLEKTAVIDATSSSMIIDTLIQLNISKIDYLFISHSDEDHIRGLSDIIISDYISEIVNIYIHPDAQQNSDAFEDIAIALENSVSIRGTQVMSVNNSVKNLKINNLYGISVKYPGVISSLLMGKNLKSTDTTNALSLVVSVDYGDESVALFCGDIEQSSLNEMISKGFTCKTKFLVFPHHGGNCAKRSTATKNIAFTEDLINSCSPETIIFSLGRNKYSNPRPEILQKIKSMNTDVKIMCTQISKHCIDVIPSHNNHLINLPSIGREKFLSCAGTIHIFHDGIDWQIANTMHQSFIIGHIPNRKC